MDIMVTTGGPIGDITLPESGAYLTYADLARQISDELDDAGDAYLPQIQAAIASAIRFCGRELLYFNQNMEVSFTAAAGRAVYEDCGAEMGAVRAVICEYNGQARPLARDYAPVLWDARAKAGRPRLYAFSGTALRLFPAPDKTCLLRLALSPACLPNARAADARSPWFTEAFGLVKARAKYELYKDILKDAPAAAAAFNDYREELAALQAETSRRCSVEKIIPTEF